VEVTCHRPGGEAPLFDEIDAVVLKELLGRRRRHGGLGDRHDRQATEVREQRRHALRREPQRVAGCASRDEELLDTLRREIADIETSVRQPSAHVGHQAELIAHRVRPITLCLELRTEPRDVADERANDLHPRRNATHDCLLSELHLERKFRSIRPAGLCGAVQLASRPWAAWMSRDRADIHIIRHSA
jgi:hypothetical protein